MAGLLEEEGVDASGVADEAEGITRVGDDSVIILLAMSRAFEELPPCWTAGVPASLLAEIWTEREGSLMVVPDTETSSELTSGCTIESEAG